MYAPFTEKVLPEVAITLLMYGPPMCVMLHGMDDMCKNLLGYAR